jgi:flagellar hook protein FlgE
MLRSLYTATSGMSAQQTKLDVTANNIANVGTAGFKKSTIQFQDTLSQTMRAATGPQAEVGGTNPAQVGLGVKVGAITTQFGQGSAENTGVATDLMIQGNGFFVIGKGDTELYTRAGSFQVDNDGRLVTADGGIAQGWMADANGEVRTGGPVVDITMPSNITSPAKATTNVILTGNLPSDAVVGKQLIRDVTTYDAAGVKTTVSLSFTRTGDGWDVAEGGANIGTLAFTNGALTAGGTATTAGGITVDLTGLKGFAAVDTLTVKDQDGAAAGTLTSYSITSNGSIVGVFTNGEISTIGQMAMASFTNNAGLERAGNTSFTATANSGAAVIGTAGDGANGELLTGSLEMSNVDLSSEMVSLITSQRALQSNSRVLTTSDSILEELVNLKR